MAASHAPAELDPERDFERLRPPARRRFLARARRAGQAGHVDLDAAADDAYQEAWLELQRRPGAVVEHDPAGYLAGIMWHRFHRLELRPARVETAPLEDDGPAGGAEPDAVVGNRQTLAAVRDALAELPDRERTALLLRAEGLSHADVAAILGVSPRIARKLAERGRARLTYELEVGERCASIASTLRAIGLGWPVRGDRRSRLEDHVAHCVTCRATVAALRREGALATAPAVLARAGTLARLRDIVEGVLGRGGGEAAAAAAGTKLVAGCLAAGVCVVGAVQLAPPEPARQEPALRATAVARAPAHVAPPPVAPDPQGEAAPTARREQVAAREAQRRASRQRASARERARAGVERARAGAEQARAGAEQARVGAERARAGAEQARVGAERARAGAEQARAAVPAIRGAGERAADAGSAAAKRATEAGERARDAADRVREALAGLGGG